MKLFADYHIHTKKSNLKKMKESINEIAQYANSIGINEIAVVFHGLKHISGCKKEDLLIARNIINEINSMIDINVLLAIEADILSIDGTLDVDDEMIEIADLLMIGYHKMIKTDFASFFGRQKKTDEVIDLTTDAYINAIKKYPVDIVVHPNVGVKVDLYKLGKFCSENDVLIELNNKYLDLTEEEINDLIRTNCYFIISSNSYSIATIGRFDNVMLFVEKYNIPLERILNIDIFNGKKTKLELEIEEDYKRLMKVKEKYNSSFNLSDEMENRLTEIKKEKGISEDIKKYDIKELLSDEDRELVERAEYYIKTGIKK